MLAICVVRRERAFKSCWNLFGVDKNFPGKPEKTDNLLYLHFKNPEYKYKLQWQK